MPGVTSRAERRRLVRCVAAVLFVVLALASAVIGPHQVLCIGADGHVGLEPAGIPCCDGGAPLDVGEAGAAGTADDCGPCLDVDLPDTTARPSGGRAFSDLDPSVLPATAATPRTFADLVVVAERNAAAILGCDRDVPRGAPAHLRSVVLRC